MTVDDLIERARWEDASFTERRHSGPVLRAHLADYQKSLVRRVAEIAPEELAVAYDINMPLADHEAGHQLVEIQESVEIPLRYIRTLNEGEWEDAGGNKGSLEVIPNIARFANSRVPPVIILRGVVYPRGVADSWAEIVRIRLFYIPLPADEVGPADEPEFHDLASRAYTTHLAFAMAARSKATEIGRPLKNFEADSLAAEAEFLDAMSKRHEMSDRVRQVW